MLRSGNVIIVILNSFRDVILSTELAVNVYSMELEVIVIIIMSLLLT